MGDTKETKQLMLHANPDLGLAYYDMFNIHVRPEEVVLEFGNHNRYKPGEATVLHRAVVSPGNAVKLQRSLQKAIAEMEARLRGLAEEARG